MFRTNLKVALRNLLRNRFYSLINILGLSAGIAVSVTILLYIQNELTYDQYHEKKDRIYRLSSILYSNGKTEQAAIGSREIGPMLAEEMEGIEAFCRLRRLPRFKLASAYNEGYEERIMLADSSLFHIFTTDLLLGDSDTCLRRPNSIVLSQQMALKYFGFRNPIGDTLEAGNKFKYVVTGVFRDLPDNTHHRYEALLSYATVRSQVLTEEARKIQLWTLRDYTFLLFREGWTPKDFYASFAGFYDEHMAEVGQRIESRYQPLLERLPEVHMREGGDLDHFASGNMNYIYAFAAVGIFTLLLAMINYTNMATARSVTRSREVGLRKVLGSRRRQLVAQFLGEAILLSSAALVLALGLVEVVLELTPFNQLMEKELRLNLFSNPTLLVGSLLITLVLGFLAGLYPAFYLSRISPIKALRARKDFGGGSKLFRKSLVVFQFSIAVGVIICTFLMKNQVEYMQTMEMGFNDDKICVVPVTDSITRSRLPEIRQELESHPGVAATTLATNVPAHSVGRLLFHLERTDGLEEQVSNFMAVDMDYVHGMGLKIVKGRDFEVGSASDSTQAVLINETAARKLFNGDALGKRIEWGLDMGGFKLHSALIVGIVNDFNFSSLHHELAPLVLIPKERPGGMLHIRLSGLDPLGTIDFIRDKWSRNEAAGSPFNMFFINEKFAQLYNTDQRLSRLMGILAYICVLISILGLVGFASYTLELRRKEIGIRKVMGASTPQIVGLLFRDVFVLILLSSVLGSVLAFLVIKWWLSVYAYQASIPVQTFLLAGASLLILALLTVSYHSVKAALTSPVQSLKYE